MYFLTYFYKYFLHSKIFSQSVWIVTPLCKLIGNNRAQQTCRSRSCHSSTACLNYQLKKRKISRVKFQKCIFRCNFQKCSKAKNVAASDRATVQQLVQTITFRGCADVAETLLQLQINDKKCTKLHQEEEERLHSKLGARRARKQLSAQ